MPFDNWNFWNHYLALYAYNEQRNVLADNYITGLTRNYSFRMLYYRSIIYFRYCTTRQKRIIQLSPCMWSSSLTCLHQSFRRYKQLACTNIFHCSSNVYFRHLYLAYSRLTNWSTQDQSSWSQKTRQAASKQIRERRFDGIQFLWNRPDIFRKCFRS